MLLSNGCSLVNSFREAQHDGPFLHNQINVRIPEQKMVVFVDSEVNMCKVCPV